MKRWAVSAARGPCAAPRARGFEGCGLAAWAGAAGKLDVVGPRTPAAAGLLTGGEGRCLRIGAVTHSSHHGLFPKGSEDDALGVPLSASPVEVRSLSHSSELCERGRDGWCAPRHSYPAMTASIACTS
jgi:hypothetical protein